MRIAVKRMFSVLAMTGVLVPSPVIFKADATQPHRDYLKHVYGSTTAPVAYTLYGEELTTTEAMFERVGVIGEDDREKGAHNGIVYLYTDDASLGSGFIVSNHVIATAAHCVYVPGDQNHAATDYFISGIKIKMYDENGAMQGTTLTPVEVHVPSDYNGMGTEIGQKHDYALITVKEDLSGLTYFRLGHVHDTDNSDSTNIPVFASGYPSSVNGSSNSSNRYLYTGIGYIFSPPTDLNPLSHLLYHTADISVATSGGPIYTITEHTTNTGENATTYKYYTAISLCSVSYTTCNWGPRFNSYIIQFYLNNEYISY